MRVSQHLYRAVLDGMLRETCGCVLLQGLGSPLTHVIDRQGRINPVHDSRLTPWATQLSWEVADGGMKFVLNAWGRIFGEVQLQLWLLQAPRVQGIPHFSFFCPRFRSASITATAGAYEEKWHAGETSSPTMAFTRFSLPRSTEEEEKGRDRGEHEYDGLTF